MLFDYDLIAACDVASYTGYEISQHVRTGREAKVNKRRRQDALALRSPQLPARALAGLIPL